MNGWVLRITKMMSEVLFEKLVKQVVWRWPKKLISSVIGKRPADQQQMPMIEKGSNSPSNERADKCYLTSSDGTATRRRQLQTTPDRWCICI